MPPEVTGPILLGQEATVEDRPRTILLVALSGYGQEDDIRKSREARPDYHVVKLADIANLRELLRVR